MEKQQGKDLLLLHQADRSYLELETMFGSNLAALIEHAEKHGFVELMWLFFINTGQRRTGGFSHSKMIDAFSLGLEIISDIPEAFKT